MNRVQRSREFNNLRKDKPLRKLSDLISPRRKIAKVEEPRLETSPLQSIVSSITEESEKSDLVEEIRTIKIKTFREINEDMLIANYIADSSLQTVREAIKRRDINKLTKANKLFAPVFKDLRIDGDLVYLENRLVIP